MAEYIEREAEMDVREKYVMQKVSRKEKSICPNCIHHNLCIAENNQPCFECNRFIDAHGVTVQEWVSVKDRLPDSCGFPCLLCGENSFGQIRVFEGFTGYMERGKYEWHSNQKDVDIDVWTITHWMPLPHPPKGE